MKILPRYLIREFAQYFFLGLGAFSAIYLVVEFFERINAFLQNKAPLALMGDYFLNKIPSIIFQVAPASILFSSIITLGLMSRHNEILAMKSGGISLRRIAFPILGVVLISYFLLLGMSEYVVPFANERVNMIQDFIIHKKKPAAAFKQNKLWIHGRQAIYNIQLYHPEKDLLEGITLYRFDQDFSLVERLDARSARWHDGRWIFSEVSRTHFSPEGSPIRKQYAQLILTLPETPGDFRIAEKNPAEMSYRELREYVRKIEQDGYNSTKYRCAMHAIFSYPFIGVIMAFLGIPIALRKERGAGVTRGIAFSILISFAYLVVFSFSLELGKAGTLPPFLSAWLGNFIFALVGAYLFLSVRH